MKTQTATIFTLFSLFLGFSCSPKGIEKDRQQTDSHISHKESNHKKEETKQMVIIHTDYGDMKVALYNETPLHRDNFLKLVGEGFYNGTLFHRVIKGFMIQGGDPDSKNAKPEQMLGMGGPGYTIPAEFNTQFIHKKGALAAARMGDQQNPSKASSGSQFYIAQGEVYNQQSLTSLMQRMGKVPSTKQMQAYTTQGGVPHLDGDYTVFGEVVEGLDVIDKIAALHTQRGDRPVQDVKITITPVEVK